MSPRSVKVPPLKKKKEKRNRIKRKRGGKFQPLRPVAKIWPDAIGSPERARVVAAAALNYTWSDMWRVRGANMYASERKPHREEKWHPPQKDAKLCSIYGKKKKKKMDVRIDAGRIRAFVLLGEENELQWLSWLNAHIHTRIHMRTWKYSIEAWRGYSQRTDGDGSSMKNNFFSNQSLALFQFKPKVKGYRSSQKLFFG